MWLAEIWQRQALGWVSPSVRYLISWPGSSPCAGMDALSPMEWVHRLAQEPGRLAGRYLLGIPLFIGKSWPSGFLVATRRCIEIEMR